MEPAAIPAAGLEAPMGTKDTGGKGTKHPVAKNLKQRRPEKNGTRDAAVAKSPSVF
jgi:hypothetical protein